VHQCAALPTVFAPHYVQRLDQASPFPFRPASIPLFSGPPSAPRQGIGSQRDFSACEAFSTSLSDRQSGDLFSSRARKAFRAGQLIDGPGPPPCSPVRLPPSSPRTKFLSVPLESFLASHTRHSWRSFSTLGQSGLSPPSTPILPRSAPLTGPCPPAQRRGAALSLPCCFLPAVCV